MVHLLKYLRAGKRFGREIIIYVNQFVRFTEGIEFQVGKFPFSASGKAIALGHTEGMVKLITDPEIGEILGAHLIGSEVTELLAELSMTSLLEGTTTELGWLVHPHPTISETLKEAALDSTGEAIHI